jgi:hypothetical protein
MIMLSQDTNGHSHDGDHWQLEAQRQGHHHYQINQEPPEHARELEVRSAHGQLAQAIKGSRLIKIGYTASEPASTPSQSGVARKHMQAPIVLI